MKLKSTIFIICLAAMCQSVSAQDCLMRNFQDPPRDSRPQVWWHWMNGNITRDGIRKDIEWMDRAGVGGFHCFDAGLDTPQIVERRLTFMTPEWKAAFGYALDLAEEYDMEVAIASSPGWSATGGPWVKKEDSMKTLNWRDTTVLGGRRLKITLPEGNRICGKYLTHHIFYERNRGNDFYKDIAVIAVRLPEEDKAMSEMGAVLSVSGGSDPSVLTDRDINRICKATPDDSGYAWIRCDFPAPQTVKALSVFAPDDNRLRNDVVLERSDDGLIWTAVCTRFPESKAPYQTLDVPESKAAHYRIRSLTPGKALDLTELYFHGVTKVDLGTEKAGFFTSDAVLEEHLTPQTADAVAEGDIINITDRFKDGILDWKAPAGRWKIYRFGYNLRGRFNNPASPEATGLEVDKFDSVAVAKYYRDYFALYNDASSGRVGKVLSHLMIDSFEAGCQTWTGRMAEEFLSRRGYDLLPWLPALTGQVLVSAAATERFLDDWRTTQKELYADMHYRSVDKLMKEYGITRYTESIETSRGCMMDGIEIESSGEIPMGAFWMLDEGYSSYPNTEADIHEAASAAHIYGKSIVAAESFTAHGSVFNATGQNGWAFYPANLKPAADAALASGLTRFVIHCSTHQPTDDKVPGLGLGPYGQWFHRLETWAEEARPWTDYLARSCYMLRQGSFVADIAYYYGESTNVTARFYKDRPQIPLGYSYDFLNRKALVEDTRIVGTELEAPSGARYKVLMLDDRMGCMSVRTLRRIKQLSDAGMLICGPEPERRYGSDGDDVEFEDLIKDIWHTGRQNVCPFGDIKAKLRQHGIKPALSYANPDCADIRFVHRRLDDGTELFWIANIEPQPRSLEVQFNVSGPDPVILHADTGKAERAQFRREGGVTIVTLDFSRDDAQFVLFGINPDESSLTPSRRHTRDCSGIVLDGPWNVSFQPGRGAPDSTVLDTLALLNDSPVPGIRYFSGTAVYSHTFDLSSLSSLEQADWRVILDLGQVYNLAHVRLNGHDLGTVWKEPYEIDITEALQDGANTLEIEVTNTWHNRLIGDLQNGAEQITYTAVGFYNADSPLREAGLGGPVKLTRKALWQE